MRYYNYSSTKEERFKTYGTFKIITALKIAPKPLKIKLQKCLDNKKLTFQDMLMCEDLISFGRII